MKLLSLAFALLFCYLACYPCSDNETCADDLRVRTEHSILHNHTTDIDDLCSPFCICNCCSNSQINPPNIFVFEAYCPKHSTINATYQHRAIVSPQLSIWQPPKLS